MPLRDWEQKFVAVAPLTQSGGETPLFCLPGAGGEVTIFRDMAAQMENYRPVIGLDTQNFFDVDREFTVEQLAEFCLSVIIETQPRGPYHLCGYSFGAIVAYEVANRLTRGGERVGVLALIDTGNPAFRSRISSAEAKQIQQTYFANRLGKYFRLLADGNFRTFAGSVLALSAARAGIRTRRFIRRVCLALKRPMPDVLRNNDRALFEAWSAYDPPPSALSLVLFYGEHRRAEYGGDRTLGWGLCTSGRVDVELASEGHVDMMKFPHVRGFAARLSESLRTEAR